MNKIKSILENIIIVAIILVIIQTFLHELTIFLHWSIQWRNIMLFSGLFFDVLFTIEFIVRTIAAGRGNHLLSYWIHERGWVDFLSSVPLLILDSGPAAYLYFSGTIHDDSSIGVLNVLKVVKAVRVTRILRLVRIIKIFGKIHNADSKMAQHHTSTVATISVFTIVATLIAFALFTDSSGKKTIHERSQYYKNVLPQYSRLIRRGEKKYITTIMKSDTKIIKATYKNSLLSKKIDSKVFKKNYSEDDYFIVRDKYITLIITTADIHSAVALNHIQSFIIIIFVVLSILFLYTKHFAQNISDLIHILQKGLWKKNYNLQIKIKEQYKDEEIYTLAQFYNEVYLPAKLRKMQEKEATKSGLSMSDLANFNKK